MAEETMIASGESMMSDGQIENLVNKLRDAARKHRTAISRDVAQQALGVENLGMQMFAVFLEVMSDMIVRRVRVDRTRTPQEALDATGRRQYTNRNVVAAMPHGDGEEVEVFFFNLGHYVSDDKLEEEFALRGFVAADPYTLAAVNEADPAFADDHPNTTHWKVSSGKWCYAVFNRWSDERRVFVHRVVYDWRGPWWFAGLRK